MNGYESRRNACHAGRRKGGKRKKDFFKKKRRKSVNKKTAKAEAMAKKRGVLGQSYEVARFHLAHSYVQFVPVFGRLLISIIVISAKSSQRIGWFKRALNFRQKPL